MLLQACFAAALKLESLGKYQTIGIAEGVSSVRLKLGTAEVDSYEAVVLSRFLLPVNNH